MNRSEFIKSLIAIGVASSIAQSIPFPDPEEMLLPESVKVIKSLQKLRFVGRQEQIAINGYVKYLKNQGIWDKLDSLMVFADKDLATIDFINP